MERDVWTDVGMIFKGDELAYHILELAFLMINRRLIEPQIIKNCSCHHERGCIGNIGLIEETSKCNLWQHKMASCKVSSKVLQS